MALKIQQCDFEILNSPGLLYQNAERLNYVPRFLAFQLIKR